MGEPESLHLQGNVGASPGGPPGPYQTAADGHDGQELLRLMASLGSGLGIATLSRAVMTAGDVPGPGVLRVGDRLPAPPLNFLRGTGAVVLPAAEFPVERRFLFAPADGSGSGTTSPWRYRGGCAGSTGVGAMCAELAAVNDRLTTAVAELERQRTTHETLTAVAAAGAGAAGIAAVLHEITAMPVAVEDQFGNSLAWAGADRPQPYPRPSRRRHAALVADAGRTPGPLRTGDRWVATARRGDEVLGLVALIDPGRDADRHQLFALEHAAVVLTIELAHQRDLAEAELRLRGDLVADLVTGCHTEGAHSRAAALGHDLSGPHQVLVVRWPGACHEQDAVRAVEQAARRCDVDTLVALRSPVVVVVAARPASWGRQHRWHELYRALEEILQNRSWWVGVGGVSRTPAELSRSYEESLHALAVRQRSQAPGLASFDDLGVLRFLFAGDDNRDVEQFVRDWLGVLIDYDRAKGTELVTTLAQYYDSAGNYDVTAAALHIHRSTLRYRIKRIRELSGHELGAVDSRLNLQIATRAWQVLQGAS
jgi:sugar diacid utilization regulator